MRWKDASDGKARVLLLRESLCQFYVYRGGCVDADTHDNGSGLHQGANIAATRILGGRFVDEPLPVHDLEQACAVNIGVMRLRIVNGRVPAARVPISVELIKVDIDVVPVAVAPSGRRTPQV